MTQFGESSSRGASGGPSVFVEVRDSSDSMSLMADARTGEEIESDDPIFQDVDDVEIREPMPASSL